MSYQLLRAVALSNHPLLKRSAGARALLALLAERANNAGTGFPVTTRRLCELTGIGEREVQRHMSSLAENSLITGWQSQRGRPKKGGQGLTLCVLVDEVAAWCPAGVPNRDGLPRWGEKNRGLSTDSEEKTGDFQPENRGLSTEKPGTFDEETGDFQPKNRGSSTKLAIQVSEITAEFGRSPGFVPGSSPGSSPGSDPTRACEPDPPASPTVGAEGGDFESRVQRTAALVVQRYLEDETRPFDAELSKRAEGKLKAQVVDRLKVAKNNAELRARGRDILRAWELLRDDPWWAEQPEERRRACQRLGWLVAKEGRIEDRFEQAHEVPQWEPEESNDEGEVQ